MKRYRLFGLAIFSAFIFLNSAVYGQTVMEKLKDNEDTSHFAEALENAELAERLNQKGPFTIFAPSNQFFDELSDGQKSDSDLLLNHIFMGMASERSLKVMSDIICLSGRTISIQEKGDNLVVDSFYIVDTNIRADNGIIHIINGVIR